MDFGETKTLLKLKDGYRDKEINRQLKLKNHIFLLQTKLLNLRDAIAGKRHKERIEIIQNKVLE